MNSRKKNAAIEGAGANAALLTAVPHDRPQTEGEWRQQQEAARTATMQQIGATLACQGPVIALVFDMLQREIYHAMHTNGFWRGEQDNFGQKTALVHSELSEMLEANREDVKEDDKIPEFTGEEAEAADTIIRLLDMAGRYEWRLGEAIVAKMLFNLSRPYKHNKLY